MMSSSHLNPLHEESWSAEDMSRFEHATATLCDYCKNIIDNWPSETEELDMLKKPISAHHGTKQELEFSAENGCSLCQQFAFSDTTISRTLPSYLSYESETKNLRGFVRFREPPPSNERTIKSYVTLEDDIKGWSVRSLKYGKLAAKASSYASHEISSSSTEDSLPQAKDWFKICTTAHPLCQNTGLKKFKPTRLIDLNSIHPRLCLGSKVERNERYATLSHCWGSLSFTTLRKINLEQFFIAIPSEALTRTFEHAIQISTYLGFKYLWIDSLCIVQDDDEDWRKESSLMSDVYGNSALTINAAWALDGSEGCFSPRPRNWKCQLKIHSHQEEQAIEFFPSNLDDSFRKDMPLYKRGWTLQEQILSQRSLHFTKNQVFFQCCQVKACEIRPEGYAQHPLLSSKFDHYPMQLTLKDWPSIVQDYSPRELTYSKDKIVAISGLAKIISENTSVEYVAGLWRENIEKQLGWHVSGVKSRLRTVPYLAPSWSWASVRTKVSMIPDDICKEREGTVFVKASEILIHFQSPRNPYIGISSAVLSLKCDILVHGTVERLLKENPVYTMIAGKRLGGHIHYDYREPEAVAHEIYILPIYGTRYSLKALMLLPTSERQGEYRRIGCLDIDFFTIRDWDEAISDPSCQAPDTAYTRISTNENGTVDRFIDLV